MREEIRRYNELLTDGHKLVCDFLATEIDENLPGAENKIWHRHPVWFLDGNPTVGYRKQKPGVRLMFWSGADFQEQGRKILGGKFKDASVFYTNISEINPSDLRRWLEKSQQIQWDYQNVLRYRGRVKVK